jgi:trehalose-6-phosphatase
VLAPSGEVDGADVAVNLGADVDDETVLTALRAAEACGVKVPTTRSGNRSALVVLRTLPELSASLRPKAASERFWHALTRLERAGKVKRETYTDKWRHEHDQYVVCV